MATSTATDTRSGATDSRAMLARFEGQYTVLLTTFRKDGTPVATPVSIVVDGERAYMRTYASAGKMKRLRRNPEVEVAPSTFKGKSTGPSIHGRVRILDGEEANRARQLLARKYPFLHGVLVPIAHRLQRNTTIHLEWTPG